MLNDYRIAWNSVKMRSRPGCETLLRVKVQETIFAAAEAWKSERNVTATFTPVPASWLPDFSQSRYADVYTCNGPQSLRDQIDAALDTLVAK